MATGNQLNLLIASLIYMMITFNSIVAFHTDYEKAWLGCGDVTKYQVIEKIAFTTITHCVPCPKYGICDGVTLKCLPNRTPSYRDNFNSAVCAWTNDRMDPDDLYDY